MEHVIADGVAMLMFGKAPLAETVTVEVDVHPLTGFVAVTVYVPAALTAAGFAAFTNEPPFQTIALPAEVPVRFTDVTEHVIVPELEDVKIGAVVSLETTTVEVDVQPFVPLVAVTVYVPAAVTVAGFAAFTNAPPFHTIVDPALVPVKVEFNAVHVKFAELADVTTGAVVLLETKTVEVEVQPVIEFVAVTVYVPAAVTVAGFAAFTNAPPFHTIVEPTLVPVNVEFKFVQLILLLLAEVTVGAEFTVIVTVEDAVPFDH